MKNFIKKNKVSLILLAVSCIGIVLVLILQGGAKDTGKPTEPTNPIVTTVQTTGDVGPTEVIDNSVEPTQVLDENADSPEVLP